MAAGANAGADAAAGAAAAAAAAADAAADAAFATDSPAASAAPRTIQFVSRRSLARSRAGSDGFDAATARSSTLRERARRSSNSTGQHGHASSVRCTIEQNGAPAAIGMARRSGIVSRR